MEMLCDKASNEEAVAVFKMVSEWKNTHKKQFYYTLNYWELITPMKFDYEIDKVMFGLLMTSEIVDLIVIIASFLFHKQINKIDRNKNPINLLIWMTIGSFLNTFFFFQSIWIRIPHGEKSYGLLIFNYTGMYLNSIIPLQYINV